MLEVDSAVHLHELKNFAGDELRTRTNQELGREAVRKLVFKLKG